VFFRLSWSDNDQVVTFALYRYPYSLVYKRISMALYRFLKNIRVKFIHPEEGNGKGKQYLIMLCIILFGEV